MDQNHAHDNLNPAEKDETSIKQEKQVLLIIANGSLFASKVKSLPRFQVNASLEEYYHESKIKNAQEECKDDIPDTSHLQGPPNTSLENMKDPGVLENCKETDIKDAYVDNKNDVQETKSQALVVSDAHETKQNFVSKLNTGFLVHLSLLYRSNGTYLT